jgi:hypothetical protein
MNITTIAFILIGLTPLGWGLIGHSSVAIGVGVVIFLLGLALDVDQREWR